MSDLGRINVILKPGDTIPEDCTIIRAFTEPSQKNAHVITVEAEWLYQPDWYDDLIVLECVTMKELYKRRMDFHMKPLDTLVNGLTR